MDASKCSVVSPGNTNTGLPTSKKYHCDFQLTLNNEKNGDVDACNIILMKKYDKLIDYLSNLKYRYIIACKETNKKGFSHIHIYIQFEKARKLSIKKCQGAHIEICRGSAQENIDYIKKDNNILIELGSPKLIRKSTIKDIINSKNNDDLLDFDIRFIKCINEVKNNSIQWNQPIYNTPKNIFIIPKLDDDIVKDCKCINYIGNKFQGLSKNILIDLTDYINLEKEDDDLNPNIINFDIIPLIEPLNKPLHCVNQIFYPADISKIVICYPSRFKKSVLSWFRERKFYFKNHDIHLTI